MVTELPALLPIDNIVLQSNNFSCQTLAYILFAVQENLASTCMAKLMNIRGTLATENLVTDLHRRACIQSEGGSVVPTLGGGEYREFLCQKSKYQGKVSVNFDD